MKNRQKNFLFLLFLIILGLWFEIALAQTEVTFNVNLKPQLEDSVFIPSRDIAKLIGNQYPLDLSRGIQLRDTEPVDSIYSVMVRFPRRVQGQKLSYNFILKTVPETLKESLPRHLELRQGEFRLDALYFDSFAW